MHGQIGTQLGSNQINIANFALGHGESDHGAQNKPQCHPFLTGIIPWPISPRQCAGMTQQAETL
ncbi:MAG: hypothetical protein L0387_43335 [Acidobacteria bacterium]|nr:hypothetical protein [Acidobacteriota bacterium]MCI0723216.1 hypothetical protein [Acidobacteriota bacterium]